MSLKVTIETGTVLAPDEFRAKVETAIRMAVAGYTQRMTAWVRDTANVPRATGYLQESGVQVISQSTAQGSNFRVLFGFGAEYASFVEWGRAPGKFPPIDMIAAWCVVKGIPEKAAFVIARAIARRGIQGRFMFLKGVTLAQVIWQDELNKAMQLFKLQGIVIMPNLFGTVQAFQGQPATALGTGAYI